MRFVCGEEEPPSEMEPATSLSAWSHSKPACPPPPVPLGRPKRRASLEAVPQYPPPLLRLKPVCYAAQHPSCMAHRITALDLEPESPEAPLTAWDFYTNSVDFYMTVREALKDALHDYRFTHVYRPILPHVPAYKSNLQIIAVIDVMLIPLLDKCEDYLDAHSIIYCGGIAACRLAGIDIPEDDPTPKHIGTGTLTLQIGWRCCQYEKILATIKRSKKYFGIGPPF